MEFKALFRQDDDPKFMDIVSKNLEQGASVLHSLSPEQYVSKCRELWQECETDEVFTFKIIIDKPLLERNRPKGMPWDGMEELPSPHVTDDDLYCIALGLITPNGELIGAPEGYDSHPKNPRSKRGVAVALPSDTQSEEPDDTVATPYLLVLLDFLGFEHRLNAIGLDRMRELYARLIEVALKPYAEANLWSPFLVPVGPNKYSPGMFWLPMRYAYFSDSILLWVPYRPEFAAPFLTRCCDVFCEALLIGVPLRGSVAAGRLILHKKTNTFLGSELVEAARLEKAQEWLGVTLGASVRSEDLKIPFDPRLVRVFDPPIKPGTAHLLSGLVLDWPRRWRDLHTGSATTAIDSLRAPGFEIYYDNAKAFVELSDSDPDWFLCNLPSDHGT